MTQEQRLLRESVIRVEIRKIQERLDVASTLPRNARRLTRYRLRHIKQDYAKLERVAQKWGLLVVKK